MSRTRSRSMLARETKWRNSEKPRKPRSLQTSKPPDKSSLKSKLLISLQ